MRLQYKQIECAEWDLAAQKFIFRNVKPHSQIFSRNVFQRIHADLPRPFLLLGGFPCRAFSWLRAGNTELLADPEAKGFWAMVDTLKAWAHCTCV